MDERFPGLPVASSLVTRTLIQELAAHGKVVLFCSHELEVVARVCAHVVILQCGKRVPHGSIQRLRTLSPLANQSSGAIRVRTITL